MYPTTFSTDFTFDRDRNNSGLQLFNRDIERIQPPVIFNKDRSSHCNLQCSCTYNPCTLEPGIIFLDQLITLKLKNAPMNSDNLRIMISLIFYSTCLKTSTLEIGKWDR